VLLVGLASRAKDPKSLALLLDALSYEPYAIALPRGDWAMKQAVDAALAQIYRSSAIGEIYARWFPRMGKPGRCWRPCTAWVACPNSGRRRRRAGATARLSRSALAMRGKVSEA
jgi:hypothetical protein